MTSGGSSSTRVLSSPTSSSPTRSTGRHPRRSPPCWRPCRSAPSLPLDRTHKLPHPFFVLATQNPIEQEGTYPLPEAQLDRFMFNIWVDYPEYADELEVVKRTTGGESASVNPVLSGDEIAAFQQHIRKMPVADNVDRVRRQASRQDAPRPRARP